MQIYKLVNDIIASNDRYGAAQSWARKPFQAWVSSCCGIQTAPHPRGAELFPFAELFAFAGVYLWLRWGFIPLSLTCELLHCKEYCSQTWQGMPSLFGSLF